MYYNHIHLITGRASGLDGLGVMPAAEELPVLVEVDEVDEELLALGADEAVGVPYFVGTRAGCGDPEFAGFQGRWALEKGSIN